jgi:hypothetical protein
VESNVNEKISQKQPGIRILLDTGHKYFQYLTPMPALKATVFSAVRNGIPG